MDSFIPGDIVEFVRPGWYNIYRANGIYIATIQAENAEGAKAQFNFAVKETANMRHMVNR